MPMMYIYRNEFIIASAKKALASGAINLENYENNFQLPKILMTAILKEAAMNYSPLSSEGKREVENFKHFL